MTTTSAIVATAASIAIDGFPSHAQRVKADHYRLAAQPPVAACEPPPPGPRRETDEEFQRRVDELLSYKTPLWRDAAFICLVTGVLCLALSGTLWWFGH